MTFEQLLYFITATEQDTFLSAADTLATSQSALSKQIIHLEKELGVSLFDRSKRKARLTQAGEVFYEQAQILYHQYEQMNQVMEEFRGNQDHTLHIGTLPFLTQYHLTEKIQAFTKLHPEISIQLEEVEETALLSGFQRGTYDLVLIRSELLDPSIHDFYPLAQDELTAVIPKDHHLSDRSCITIKELAKERFILMNPYTSIYQSCIKLFQTHAVTPHILRTARVESILSAVALGEGISLLSKSNFQVFHSDAVTLLPLCPAVHLSVGAACIRKKEKKACTRTFLNYITR